MFSQVGFVDLDVVEGGNDVCVVANKLIIIGWRLLTPRKSADVLWTLPLAILELPLAALALVCAHVSLLMNLGSLDDPLGYSILCFKKLNVPDSLSAS